MLLHLSIQHLSWLQFIRAHCTEMLWELTGDACIFGRLSWEKPEQRLCDWGQSGRFVPQIVCVCIFFFQIIWCHCTTASTKHFVVDYKFLVCCDFMLIALNSVSVPRQRISTTWLLMDKRLLAFHSYSVNEYDCSIAGSEFAHISSGHWSGRRIFAWRKTLGGQNVYLNSLADLVKKPHVLCGGATSMHFDDF